MLTKTGKTLSLISIFTRFAYAADAVCLEVNFPSAITSLIHSISCFEINESKNTVTLRYTKKGYAC